MTLLAIMTFQPFEWRVVGELLIIVVLLALSALTSSSETALFSLTPAEVERIGKSKSRTSHAMRNLLADTDSLLATVLIFNNLVNILIILLSDSVIDRHITFSTEGWKFAFTSVVVTFVLLLFGEIMPKIYANFNHSAVAHIVAIPLLWLKRILKPLWWVLVKYSNALQRKGGEPENISMDELQNALEITENPSETEKEMLSGIVSFVNTEVEEIMHPRLDIEAFDIESSFSEVKKTIIESGFSRIPTYKQDIDHIVGILYVKDMLPYVTRGDDFEWADHLRPAYYTPAHKKINDLLEEFQGNKVHMAIVIDEYGSTVGLVSLEDILEEIVGEITDESDTEEEALYKQVDAHTWIFNGKTHICQLEEVLDTKEGLFDDVRGPSETVAGMLLETKRDFLRRGDSLNLHGIRFTVISIVGHRAEEIKVEK
ncbi:MAG: gliding motility-associated protein GldE [Tidjanibacter sp.]|nr:gliding motility-associated protein GldE [Tidjanibacter sp.]